MGRIGKAKGKGGNGKKRVKEGRDENEEPNK